MTYDINFLIMLALICMDFYVEIILCLHWFLMMCVWSVETARLLTMERSFRISDQCFQRSAEWHFFRQSCSEKSWDMKMTIGHRRMIRIIENGKKIVAWRKITQNIHQCDIKPNREFKPKTLYPAPPSSQSRFSLSWPQLTTNDHKLSPSS